MLKVKNIDHVAIAVSDLDPAAMTLGRLFGLTVGAEDSTKARATPSSMATSVGSTGWG